MPSASHQKTKPSSTFNLALPVFLSSPLFPDPDPVQARIYNPVLPIILGKTDPYVAFSIIIANVWKASVTLGSVFFVLYFAMGSLRWITSAGDKAKLESGRQMITNGLIGILLLAASVAIIQLLGGILQLPFFDQLTFTIPTI